MDDQVILVDENDREIGIEEKIKAHQAANLHRAFSIFIFDSEGKMLIQQRAFAKYHSPGLWTNACCSHPRPGESVMTAAHRRLQEEMGFECELHEKFNFIYRAEFDNGLTEHEFDHVLFGIFDGVPKPNMREVASYRWINIDELEKDVAANGDAYTVWFKIALRQVLNLNQDQ